MQQGLLGRISRTAILEYHTFGIIRYCFRAFCSNECADPVNHSAGKYSAYHYMICGVQGDFTRKLVADMPTHIWTREVKVSHIIFKWSLCIQKTWLQFAGVGNTSTLYKRGIRICTGTGIGAALSTCLQSDQWFLIWIGKYSYPRLLVNYRNRSPWFPRFRHKCYSWSNDFKTN